MRGSGDFKPHIPGFRRPLLAVGPRTHYPVNDDGPRKKMHLQRPQAWSGFPLISWMKCPSGPGKLRQIIGLARIDTCYAGWVPTVWSLINLPESRAKNLGRVEDWRRGS